MGYNALFTKVIYYIYRLSLLREIIDCKMENPNTPEQYIDSLEADKRSIVALLRKLFADNLPYGFKEMAGDGMLNYVVPHDIYPKGHYGSPQLPLPFIIIAVIKDFVALYHMGLYIDAELLNWFKEEYPKHSKYELEMDEESIHFKSIEQLPSDLLIELAKKMSPEKWVAIYDKTLAQKA
jgi:hypothetical protein